MLTLQESFRQLALDLNAVTTDDPKLDSFDIAENGARVVVTFRDYKKDLRIRADRYLDGRPHFRITQRGPIDRLGQRLRIDERQVFADDDFNVEYELYLVEDRDIDPISARHAVATIFDSAAAREAVRAVDKSGVLPVFVSSSGVEWRNWGGTGRSDLTPEHVKKVAAACAQLARALPDAKASAPSNEPLRGLGGRKVIRRVKGESVAQKVFGALDLWPLWLVIGGAGLTGAWLGADAHRFVDLHLWLAPSSFVTAAAVAFPLFLLMLRGTNNALAMTLWRSLGVSTLFAFTVYFGLHIADVAADGSDEKREPATVVKMRPAFGPIPGETTLRTRRDTFRVMGDEFGKAGDTAQIAVHPGRIGWRWLEKTRDR